MVTSKRLTPAAPVRMYIGYVIFLFAGLGCAATNHVWAPRTSNDWVADYDAAEARVRESDRPLLIYFKGNRHRTRDPIRAVLDDPAMRRRIEGYVRCTLFHAYEPDRRYVAQFGVERAPALVVVHRDGTYHATSGHLPAERIARFLADATPPGKLPTYDPYIPRRPRYEWLASLDAAEQAVKRSNQPMLAVYTRRFSNDWRKVRRLLNRPEVSRRLANAIHCRIEVGSPLTEAYITPFGTLRLPAIAIAQPDGSFESLAVPTSADAIVRFVDGALKATGGAAVRGVAASARTASSP